MPLSPLRHPRLLFSLHTRRPLLSSQLSIFSRFMATAREQPTWRQPTAHPEAQSLPSLKVYNSLTKSKTPFIPIDPQGKQVTWYACGPTVYDDAHLGHARNYVSTDIIRRIMRDYFQFDVNFVMNITDVDDKIILRARQQHLFTRFVTTHPTIDGEVLDIVKKAYTAYLKKNLPLLSPDLSPSQYPTEVQNAYSAVLSGGALPGNEKAGDDEAKVKMHIKTALSAANVIAEAEQLGKPAQQTFPERFYTEAQDLLLPYLDVLEGSAIDADDHGIFTKLTRKYEERFMKDMDDLNVIRPDELTRVTEYGQEIADFVKKIVENEFGYVTADGSVYFDINAFEAAGFPYARLEPWSRSDNKLLAEGEGALTNKSTEKRSKSDFALWKASKPGEPSWSSSWGRGRPGWHIECSAMASARLGKQMDIHSGGIDLAFPHHDNELAQSEAYWHSHDDQWVNYFLHMGHLSIQGSKMSKSLKNFTTIREALERKEWTSRSLRIVFLLGGWKEGVEITDDLVNAGNSWEDKLNNFFIKVKDPAALQGTSTSTDSTVADALSSAKSAVNEQLCDSFNTPGVMASISELITKYNSADKSTLNPKYVEATARWVTYMVNVLGLNGQTPADSQEIGWNGIDVPEEAKTFLYPLSTMRDSLRQAARAKAINAEEVSKIVERGAVSEAVTDATQPYASVLSNFRTKVSSLGESANLEKEILTLCDRVRDVDLFDVGVYLEDRENLPAIVRPVSRDLIQAREAKVAQALQKQREKEAKEKEALKKLEKGKLSHLEMFRTNEYSAWDEEGLPTRDTAGEEVTKSRAKKLRKDWERQKKLHETWLASQQESK
ncbi:tRNA synthetases class I (C) catalytic domain-containing protein [Aspergillus cavernicola]|uniref:cysteine--tRNA ligase n=1 Tax=Aspergillus cavernicola TaxID=176166 RepID=A0ABR4I8G1_9EURO